MDGESNGHVRFGDAPGNVIPAAWVEPLLRKLRAQYVEAFGQRLSEVAAEQMNGTKVRAGKPRK